jgi:hypothetical protein
MPEFVIQKGAAALCSWNTETGVASFHPRAERNGDLLIIEETLALGFTLSPAETGREYRITLGDVPLADVLGEENAAGLRFGTSLLWQDAPYYESARGHTPMVVESRREEKPQEGWSLEFATDVYVLPSKLGEDRFWVMGEDMRALSRVLLLDLYGKSRSTFDSRFRCAQHAAHSREEELKLLGGTLADMESILLAMAKRPASKIQTVPCTTKFWGDERIAPRDLVALSRRAVSPYEMVRPIQMTTHRKSETFDIPEHRMIRAFLEDLSARAKRCARVAGGHIRSLTKEQHLRHVRQRDGGQTLFERYDQPRIEKLRCAVQTAHRYEAIVKGLCELPFLREVSVEVVLVRHGMFERGPEYLRALRCMRNFMRRAPTWDAGDALTSTNKLTSRLFEQWCYLKVVDAFRTAGLDLQDWGVLLRQRIRDHFILDFDRGMAFEGNLGGSLRLRFRYEPWIFGEAVALQREESLFRGVQGQVAWCPDIVIECLKEKEGRFVPVYVLVLDAKYRQKITEQQWGATQKYFEIRSSVSGRAVVRQLWLISPGEIPEILSMDPKVRFLDDGPSSPPDEPLRFNLVAAPSLEFPAESYPKSSSDPFLHFAVGTINFLRRHFMNDD